MRPTPLERIKNMREKNFREEIILEEVEKELNRGIDENEKLKKENEELKSTRNTLGELNNRLAEELRTANGQLQQGIEREREYKELLEDCEEYFDNKADADHNGENFVPNKEMEILSRIRQFLTK